jgi:hypothetical protein
VSLILVAAIACVRDAVFLGHERIRNGEAVIVTPVALHVNGLRHVAVHALAARAVWLMKGMRLGDDDRGIGKATRRVAAHAELVAWQDRFHAVHVMAVHAAHPGVVHATAQEGSELVVFIADLAVGVIGVVWSVTVRR